MAFRTWAKLLAATLGVGALAGASQLGLVYGLLHTTIILLVVTFFFQLAVLVMALLVFQRSPAWPRRV